MNDETHRAIGRLAAARTFREAEGAWDSLRGLGEDVVPHLVTAYPSAPRACARVAMVSKCIRYARTSESAYQLGITALADRATLVRYRACGLLAYSLRGDAIPALRMACQHPDSKTADDAAAAIRAIQLKNHHLFVDRAQSGRTHWIVNWDTDEATIHVPPRRFNRIRRFLGR